MDKPKVIAIVGQTATGKTALSIKLAHKFNGEIISADSRQVYQGMDIGTGKVTEVEMQGVPHHLLDIANPNEVYTAADFKRDAEMAIEDILKRGKLPIIVGGTYFYIQLLRGELQSAPVAPNKEFRKSLEEFTNAELFEKLKTLDLARAETIDADNRRRLIRALEIVNSLGVVPQTKKIESDYDWLLIGTKIDKTELHQKISLRLEQRLKEGMVAEAEKLHAEGVSFERMDALGLEYRYLAKYLKHEINEEELFTQLETKIKQFAKRQLTWLKRDQDIKWFKPQAETEINALVENFLHC